MEKLNFFYVTLPISQNFLDSKHLDHLFLAWEDYTPYWCSKTKGLSKPLAENVKSSEACIALCLKSNPNCKAVEWWANDGQDCFECTRPSLKTKFTDTTDGGYPPHVLVKPEKPAGELKPFAGKVLEVKIWFNSTR